MTGGVENHHLLIGEYSDVERVPALQYLRLSTRHAKNHSRSTVENPKPSSALVYDARLGPCKECSSVQCYLTTDALEFLKNWQGGPEQQDKLANHLLCLA